MLGAHNGSFVAYCRVSTQRRGRSGLGLKAQQKAVLDHLNGCNWKIVDQFTEVESGTRTRRPKLAEALKTCRRLAPPSSSPNSTSSPATSILCPA
jgi:DNA invertase Pin-like site-specific DNA recombinase